MRLQTILLSLVIALNSSSIKAGAVRTALELEKDGKPLLSSSMVVGKDGILYYGLSDGLFYAGRQSLMPDTVSTLWRFRTGGRIVSSAALGNDRTLYFGSGDGFLYALNTGGELKWKFETGAEIWSSPALEEDGTVYFGSLDHFIYSLDSEGQKRWSYETDSCIISSPALGNDGTLYVGSLDCHLYALDCDGALKWKYATGEGIISSPAVGSEGEIYFGSNDGYLYALRPDGSLAWRYPTAGPVVSSPGLDYAGKIYFGSSDSIFYCLNADGTLSWKYRENAAIWSSPVVSSQGDVAVCTNNFTAWDGRYDESSQAPLGVPDLMLVYDSTGLSRTAGSSGKEATSTSPFIGPDGGIYLFHGNSSAAGKYQITSSSDQAPWPKFRHDYRNTGNFSASKAVPPYSLQEIFDFNGDGATTVSDVIALILLGRQDPGNPSYDINQDGLFSINDAIILLLKIQQGVNP